MLAFDKSLKNKDLYITVEKIDNKTTDVTIYTKCKVDLSDVRQNMEFAGFYGSLKKVNSLLYRRTKYIWRIRLELLYKNNTEEWIWTKYLKSKDAQKYRDFLKMHFKVLID